MKASKGSIKGSPAVSNEKSTTGKKLVQARLPFKILPSPVRVEGAPLDNETRKRKLSSEGDLPPSKILCSSEIKENLSKCAKDTIVLSDDESPVEEAPHNEGTSSLNPVVKLNNIDSFIEDSLNDSGKIILSPKTPKVSKKSGQRRGSASNSGKSNKLHIKLPISNKKRRKLSEKLNMPRNSDDEGISKEKKFKVYSEEARDGKDSIESDVIEIKDDEASLSAEICLQVTMSQDSMMKTIVDSKKTNENSPNSCQLSSSLKGTDGFAIPFKKPGLSSTVVGDEEDIGQKSKNDELDKNDKPADKTESAKGREESSPDKKSFQGQESSCKNVEDKNQILKVGDVPESSFQPEHKECLVINDEEQGGSAAKEKVDVLEINSDDEERGQTPVKSLESTTNLRERVLTPKQVQKFKEREEKQKQREEEKLLRQKEKEEKERLRKKEREEKEEQKRREKEEKDEQRRKEKEEKEKKRLAEIEAKNEERRQKEEEKRKKEELKEEERKKKEDDRKRKEQEKEEAENKKRKAAEAFTKFFVQPKTSGRELEDDQSSLDTDSGKNLNFMPFQVKGDMKLAPMFRKILDCDARAKLDTILEDDSYSITNENLYLNCLKSGKIYLGKDSRTCLMDDDNASDCLVIEDELERAGQTIYESSKPRQKYRAKFLYFHQNQRPPYYGTWRKKSVLVKPRRPFATDTNYFDYEVDSDDEWEEEEPGESLHGSDDEKESEDEYEVDNEFFVPHGHLSDEELQNEDELDDDNTPEMQKEKLKLLQQEFAQEMKKKTEKIKPRLLGIVWQDETGARPELCPSIIWESLNKRAMIFSALPIIIEPEKGESEAGSPVQEKKPLKRTQLADNQIKDLIRLVHGNRNKKEFMIREFQAFIAKQTAPEETPVEYTKTSIRDQIDKMAEWRAVEDEMKKKKRLWMVFPDVLKQYDLEGLSNINSWEYILPPRRVLSEITKTDEILLVDQPTAEKGKEPPVRKKKKKEKKDLTAITKFTTVISKEAEKESRKEVEKSPKPLEFPSPSIELDIKPMDTVVALSSSLVSKSSPAVKKRVPLLMSVPRGQRISESTKNALISDFLKKKPAVCKDPPDTSEDIARMNVDTIIID